MRRVVLSIIFEDEDVLVVNKPAGLLTSTVPRERRPTLLAMVREYVHATNSRARVGLIHRLDRDASGLLIFSKNHRAYASLKRQFFHHTVDRIYLAVVDGVVKPARGRIESRLLELADGRVVTVRNRTKGQNAITEYETLSSSRTFTVLRVRLHTGRKHQIRAHLAQRGFPILNDPMYGSGTCRGQMMLAAVELTLEHPRTRRRVTFRIDPPARIIHPPETSAGKRIVQNLQQSKRSRR